MPIDTTFSCLHEADLPLQFPCSHTITLSDGLCEAAGFGDFPCQLTVAPSPEFGGHFVVEMIHRLTEYRGQGLVVRAFAEMQEHLMGALLHSNATMPPGVAGDDILPGFRNGLAEAMWISLVKHGHGEYSHGSDRFWFPHAPK